MYFFYRCFNLFASFALTAGIRTRQARLGGENKGLDMKGALLPLLLLLLLLLLLRPEALRELAGATCLRAARDAWGGGGGGVGGWVGCSSRQ